MGEGGSRGEESAAKVKRIRDVSPPGPAGTEESRKSAIRGRGIEVREVEAGQRGGERGEGNS